MDVGLVVLLLIPGRKAAERSGWHRVRARTVDRLDHPGDGGGELASRSRACWSRRSLTTRRD